MLYVALTRAKEKLILTGCRKDAENDLAALREAAQEEQLFPETEHVPLPYLLRESAAGYFDWLLPAVFSYHGRYQVRVVPAEELLDAEEPSHGGGDGESGTVSVTHCSGGCGRRGGI